MSGLALELFPCSGGMAEGFRRAGITFDCAFDKDPDACASYEHNHGHRPVEMDVRDLLRMARGGWRPGPVRLLVADPPCTPWSRAGKRLGVRDERDMLHVTTELIGLLRPEAYLVGNVPGLDDSTQWHHIQDALAPLRRAGYCIADYTSLDAADFGVPQHRVRPFWFGHLGGPCIRWPLPTHGPPSNGQASLAELRPWVTCREALQHLPPELLGRPVRVKNKSDLHPCSEADIPARVVPSSMPGNGGAVLLANPRHPPASPASPAATIGAKDRGQSTVLRLEDPNRPPASPDAPHRTVSTARDQALMEWPWGRPSSTIFADPRMAPPGHHALASLMSDANAIVLSEAAAAILQGFPDGWKFAGETKKARWSQIGQAMPPALAHAVAAAVVKQMERASREVA